MFISVTIKDYTQQFVQFSKEKQTTHSNMYSSVSKDRLQPTNSTVQYRQRYQTQQCVQLCSDRLTTHINIYSSVLTEENVKKFLKFHTDREASNNNVYISTLTEKSHIANCTVQD